MKKFLVALLVLVCVGCASCKKEVVAPAPEPAKPVPVAPVAAPVAPAVAPVEAPKAEPAK